MRLLTTTILISILLTSCSEIRTDDPTDSYKYWTGTKPTEDLKVLNGQYWQSGHWTREYILYLKIKPTDKWWIEFVKQNQLQIDNKDWDRPSDSPDWFQLTDKIEVYKHADDFNDSRYFRDNLTGECYIYEIQL
jgi:hypothetical protein